MTRQLMLAYGRETEHQRAIFAVLSFWAWYQGDRAAVKTVIFTDRPDLFAPYLGALPVEYRLLTADSLAHMRGALDFVHRVKLYIVDQIMQEHPGEPLFFCDSDTFFVAPAAPMLSCLQPGRSVMHQPEHSFGEAIETWASFTPPQDEYPRQFVELLGQREFALLPGPPHRFGASQMMWNSGVIGLAPNSTPLTQAILALGDEFYGGSKWILSEQAAFSLALQAQTEVVPSNHYVFHYWAKRQKAVMDGLLVNLPTLLPRTNSLDQQLGRVRKLTGSWRQVVQKDEAQQAAALAFSRGELVSGMKFTAKALLSRLRS